MLSPAEVQQRLGLIFPEELAIRSKITNVVAARTVFTMLYCGCIQGSDRWFTPMYLTKAMGEKQAAKKTNQEREDYYAMISATKRTRLTVLDRWYNDNTRETIRDDTLVKGLCEVGAVIIRTDIGTTSPKPRYALERDFAKLLENGLQDDRLETAIASWQETHLSEDALTRKRLSSAFGAASEDNNKVEVRMPDGSIKLLSPGGSSLLAKSFVEEYLPRHQQKAHVLLISESGDKLPFKDEKMLQLARLKIDVGNLLPDIILIELDTPLKLTFAEIVHTDGPIDEHRKRKLIEFAATAGYKADQLRFITIFRDRQHSAAKKLIHTIAWGTSVWYAQEPDGRVELIKKNFDSPI